MKKLFTGLLLTVLASAALAQNAQQLQLINSQRRPPVSALMADSKNLEIFNTFDLQNRSAAIKRGLPEMIVSLEKAFPGGTFAFLGRDMDLIADAVDAYYQSIGQSDRVRRIEFSTPSLANSNPELITSFLSQLGLDSTGVTSAKGPFVIIDYTSYSTAGRTNSSFPSQARYIFQSAIEQMKKNGLSEADILARLNVATTDPTAGSFVQLSVPLGHDRSTFLDSQIQSLKSRGQVDRITLLPGGDSMAYYSEWTNKFGPIVKDSSGLLKTEPLGYFDSGTKQWVYLQMVQVINAVQSQDMQTRIKTLAAQHGVEFKKVASRQVKAIKPVKVDYDAEFKKAITHQLSGLGKLPSEKQYDKFKWDNQTFKLTENGQQVLRVLADPSFVNSEHYFEISLTAMINLYKRDQLGARDFRRIFAHLLGLKEINGTEFVNMVAKQYKNVLPLEIMLGREGEREKYSQAGGVAERNFQQLIQNGQLKMSCRFSYSE